MTQGWGYDPKESTGAAGGNGATGVTGDDDTRMFPPVDPGTLPPSAGQGSDQRYNPFQDTTWAAQQAQQGGQNQQGQQAQYPQSGDGGYDPQYQAQYPAQGYAYPAPQTGPQSGGQDGGNGGNRGGRGMTVAVVVLVVLLVAALGVLLATQWNNLFGSDDSTAAPATSTVVVPPPGDSDGSGAGSTSTPPTEDSEARPTSADLPAGVTPVNTAAMNGEPTGNFNSIWISGPTTSGFAENVRNAYVEAYLADRKTDQTVSASSPTTGVTYTMTCTDAGSYIHCAGGNDAHVYIA